MVNEGKSCKRSESPPLRSESSMIIEGMNRASKYSPEEKKERIERYRSKRNQRNFNKKIKVITLLPEETQHLYNIDLVLLLY